MEWFVGEKVIQVEYFGNEVLKWDAKIISIEEGTYIETMYTKPDLSGFPRTQYNRNYININPIPNVLKK